MTRESQTLRADPNTRATAAARKAEAKHGEMEAAGEVGVGAGDSAAWALATPMREITVKRTAMRATTGVLERAIVFFFWALKQR